MSKISKPVEKSVQGVTIIKLHLICNDIEYIEIDGIIYYNLDYIDFTKVQGKHKGNIAKSTSNNT